LILKYLELQWFQRNKKAAHTDYIKFDDLDEERMPKTVKRREDMAKKYGIGSARPGKKRRIFILD